MSKSLQLQAELGPVFDVTLDNEDGAPVGGEVDHAHLIASLLAGPDNRFGRVGVRLLPVEHPRFEDVARVVLAQGQGSDPSKDHRKRPAYLMLPKPEGLADVQRAALAIDALGGGEIPLHALVETHGALRDVMALAAHPRIESLSFGFMIADRCGTPDRAGGEAPSAADRWWCGSDQVAQARCKPRPCVA